MKKSIRSILVLVCICATVAVLLSLTNCVTAPIIEKNNQNKTNGALLDVLPEGGSFEKLDLSTYTLPATVTEAYRASNGGYVIKLSTSGYSPDMVLLCGVSADGTIAGSKMISSSETPSIGGSAAEKFAPTVVGKDLTNLDSVDTVSGATKTTEGYRNAMKDALNAVIILGGGDVDLRTEEEILLDNLDAALPAANKEFDKHFFAEVVEGVDAIYTAKNGTGAVCIIGEQFIALDASNTVLTDCADADAATAVAALEAIGATETTTLDLNGYADLSADIVSIQKTNAGNYIVEIRAKGYSMQNAYAPADQKKPIVIKVSVTADGVIIDTLTLSHSESENIGDICAKEEYYGQFDGKNETEISGIDTVAGVTKTTKAYKNAILAAIRAVTTIEGGIQE